MTTPTDDGVTIRPVAPGDREALDALLSGLSDRDRYMRWFSGAADVHGAARWSAEPERSNAVGLVAVAPDGTLAGHGVLVPDGHGAGEVAFETAADWRHHGIAGRMLVALIAAARERGLHAVTAEVQAANLEMLAVFREHGGFTEHRESAVVRVELPIAPPGPDRRGAEVVVEGVTKTFGQTIHALQGVDLWVAPGEFVLLSGPSGCGKSTLLNLIAGLDRPDAGRILVDGADVATLPDPARYRRDVVGFVFQLHHLILGLTAEENVEVPLIPLGLSRRDRLARVGAALAEVDLADRARHRPTQMSGGERQRVAIARALVGRPRLLLADEPTGALDSAAGAQILELLGRVRREHGMTVLLVSHQHDAAAFADRVVHLRDGRIVAGGVSPASLPGAAA